MSLVCLQRSFTRLPKLALKLLGSNNPSLASDSRVAVSRVTTTAHLMCPWLQSLLWHAVVSTCFHACTYKHPSPQAATQFWQLWFLKLELHAFLPAPSRSPVRDEEVPRTGMGQISQTLLCSQTCDLKIPETSTPPTWLTNLKPSNFPYQKSCHRPLDQCSCPLIVTPIGL